MQISEIYEAIQGELPNMGVPMTMVRLQGCPKPYCRWCDTDYALDPKGGREYDAPFLEKILSLSKFICFSGGEPIRQEKELGILIKRLHRAVIEIETSAFYPPPKWHGKIDYWVVDYKCPFSGRKSISMDKWIDKLRKQDAVKFVVSDDEDMSFAIRNRVKNCKNVVSPTIRENGIVEDNGEVRISSSQLEWIRKVERFCIENNFLFSLQQHRLVWGLKKGV